MTEPMEKFYITITAHDVLEPKYIIAWLPKYFTCDAVKQCLEKSLRREKKNYRAHVVKTLLPTFEEHKASYTGNVDYLMDSMGDIQLFRRKFIPIKNIKEEVKGVVHFLLPEEYKVYNIQFNGNTAYHIDGMTFFKLRASSKYADFFTKDMVANKLGLKMAKSGYYFLYGRWKFYKSRVCPTIWKAVKIYREEVITETKERIERI